MSADRIEVVRQVLDAVGRRDVQAILDNVDSDVELQPLLSVWRQTYRGHDGIEEWSQGVGELWDSFSVEPEGFRDLGEDTIVVRLRWRGRAKGASTELDGPGAAVVRFQADKVISVDIHLDEHAALRSMGGS